MATADTKKAYNEIIRKPLEILGIFNDFFGEDAVDLQGLITLEQFELLPGRARTISYIDGNCTRPCILVHWPKVRITNEHDKYEDITHLYARIRITYDGRLVEKFRLNRSEYTVKHMMCGYMHSHVSSIPTHDFQEFQLPCTGSGPINTTMYSLERQYDLDIWRLFCLELDKYVHVESLAGVPYHRLEELTRGGRRSSLTRVYDTISYILQETTLGTAERRLCYPALAEFTVYLINRNVLRFAYAGKGFNVAMSPEEFYTVISNEFINWFNKKYAGNTTSRVFNILRTQLTSVKQKDGAFFMESSSGTPNINSLRRFESQPVCTFKGQIVTIHISDLEEQASATADRNEVTLLKANLACFILTKILTVINDKYGKQTNNSPNQRTIYI
jgi:hypothetical protein